MIIYEERHFLFASKVAGISSQRVDAPKFDKLEESPKDTLEQQLEQYIIARDGKLGFLQLVHRLDRVASGIVLFARSSKALSRLHESLRKREWEKFYLAFVYFKTDIPMENQLEDWLVHGDRKAFVGTSRDREAKLSRLEYKVLLKKKNTAMLGIRLHTGRYHQIRAQLSHRGWSILGDIAYGGPGISYPGIALHHVDLSVPHPIEKGQRAHAYLPPSKELLGAVEYNAQETELALKKFQEWRIASLSEPKQLLS